MPPAAPDPRDHVLHSLTIPTQLNRPEIIVGAFTRQGLLLFFVGCGLGTLCYLQLTFLVTFFGTVGLVVAVAVSALPVLFSLVLQKSVAGRSLALWVVLYLAFRFSAKRWVWCSVRQRDRYAPPLEGDEGAEPVTEPGAEE